MTIQLDIQVADDLPDSIKEPPPSSQITNWAQAAWQGDKNSQPIISLRIVSKTESQQLNNDYRGKNKPTNILSFPMQMEMNESDLLLLGDLAICAEIVEEESISQHKKIESHWAHMLVHGMLHLQGYDHIENSQAEKMEQLEIKILKSLGFSNPYQNDILNSTGIVK